MRRRRAEVGEANRSSTPMTACILTPEIDRIFLPESVRTTLQLLIFVPEVHSIILFGSRAVGDHNDKSDFDLAISAPSLTKNKFSMLRDAISHSRTLYKISLSLLDKMPEKLRERVTSQGYTIYERKEA
jgi:predicted nucleotidyltransferase